MNAEGVVGYTCITGHYEKWKAIPGDFTGFDRLVLFSNRSKRKGWEMHPFVSPPRVKSSHDINRYHKFFPHRLFPQAQFSVYLDGNVAYDGHVMDLVNHVHESGAALGIFTHPDRRTLTQEAEACERLGKFDAHDRTRIDTQLQCYRDDGFDPDRPIGTNYLIVRDHSHPALPMCMSLWWSQIFEFTKRDQLALPYVLWKIGLPSVALDEGPRIDAGRLVRIAHRKGMIMRFVTRSLKSLKGEIISG